MDIAIYHKNISQFCIQLSTDFEEKKKNKSMLACRSFLEYVARLENRHNELLEIETFKKTIDLDNIEQYGLTMPDLQLIFVDKTEAFHQQVYAAVSAFIMLLSNIADQNFLSQMPIDSLSKFLKHISDKSYDSIVKDQSSLLLKSADFRSKFIDHPQQHALHDWMTMGHLTGVCIIYYITDESNTVPITECIDPYAPNFHPPVKCKSFYVSPAHTEVFNAVLYFTEKVLQSVVMNGKDKK